MAGRIGRGDVRLYQFATPDKRRPVVALTRDSAVAYLSTVTVAPITSTIRTPCAVNLHNTVTVSQQRLGKRVTQLSSSRIREICTALRFSLGCDAID